MMTYTVIVYFRSFLTTPSFQLCTIVIVFGKKIFSEVETLDCKHTFTIPCLVGCELDGLGVGVGGAVRKISMFTFLFSIAIFTHAH